MKLANIAVRNLSRQKKRSLLLAGAIAVGIFIVTLVNGFSAGTVRSLKENMADMIGGHVFITVQHRENDKTIELITDDTALVAALHKQGIQDKDIAKTVDLEGSAIFNSKEKMEILVGVDWVADSGIRAKLAIPPADFEKAINVPNGIIISQKTAEKLQIKLGDSLLFRCKTVSGQQNVGEFIVSYVTNDTTDFGSMVTFTDKKIVNQLANLPDPKDYLNLRIHLSSVDAAPLFAAKLEKDLAKDFKIAPKSNQMMGMDSNVFQMNQSTGFTGERLQVTTINDMLSSFGVDQLSAFVALLSLVLLIVLLLIIMLGIANTFRMILYERIHEIGTMRALGMHRGEVRSLMLYEAVFLSILGVIIGVAVAGATMVILGLINFGTDSMISLLLNKGHLSFIFEPISMTVSIILVVVLTWLAALGPANKAAKLLPAEALRTTN